MPYPKWHRRNRQERVLFCDRSSRMSRTIAVLYRFLYAGLLSRLPESAAISLRQSLLRRLPLDRLGCFQLQDPRLPVELVRQLGTVGDLVRLNGAAPNTSPV